MTDSTTADVLELRSEIASDALSLHATTHRHLPALDGLRGLAILLVFLVHYGGGAKSSNFALHTFGVAITAGWTGVTLFFVLSGFLISGIIWDSQHEPHWWRNFYMRRTLRIFPLYYASLALVLLTAFLAGKGLFSLTHFYVYALYLQNLPLPWGAGNLGSPLYLSHFWSLAVEEQFYLLWPFLLPRMRSLSAARWLCVAVFVFSATFRLVAWYLLPAHTAAGAALPRAFFGAYGFTFSRVGELAAGAYLAMSYRDPQRWSRLKRMAPSACILGLAGFLVAAVSAHNFTEECAAGFLVGIPCMTLCLAALLILSLGENIVSSVSRLPLLRWFGGISYGFYIFHVLFTPGFEWIARKIAPAGSRAMLFGVTFLVAGSLSVVLAWLSFRFFESQFLRRRTRYRAA